MLKEVKVTVKTKVFLFFSSFRLSSSIEWIKIIKCDIAGSVSWSVSALTPVKQYDIKAVDLLLDV